MTGKKNGFWHVTKGLFAFGELDDLDVERRIVLLHIIFAMTFVVLTPYMIVVFSDGMFLMGTFDAIALVLMVLTLVYMEKTGDFQTPAYLVSVFLGLLFLFLVSTGGISNTGPLWSYVFPLIVVFLLGRRIGRRVFTVFFVLVVVLLFVPGATSMVTDYSGSFKFRFISSLLVVFGLSYFIEGVRARTHAKISSNAEKLEQTIAELNHARAEQSRLQEELISARKLEAVGTLAGGMAHEFNNQVSVILGNADLLLRILGGDEEFGKKLKAIRDASDRIAILTDQLLSFSRKQILQLQEVNINQLINDAQLTISKKLCEEIQLELELAPDLPMVEVDRDQIVQVLVHLASNGCDAMCKKSGGKLLIKTEAVHLSDYRPSVEEDVKNGDFVCLSIIDNGIGMNREMMQKIFDPFFTTKQQGFGIGLGLSFVYGTVKQHEGWPEISSVPDEGTTFKVFLPASRQRDGSGSDGVNDKFRLLTPTTHK